MNHIELQNATTSSGLPGQQQFQLWIDSALKEIGHDTEIVIRLVDRPESQSLNEQYRHKQGPTNILSFSVDVPEQVELDLLGDLVICVPVVEEEAQSQQKQVLDHWAHIVIHGVLHLLGYDHINDDEAELMENKEVAILKTLNINNPYTGVVTNE